MPRWLNRTTAGKERVLLKTRHPGDIDISSTQHYSCVVIPPFNRRGNLPPGIHAATRVELAARFGGTIHRTKLLDGLRRAMVSLRDAGCKRIYVDGSFVTAKKVPDDHDGCWELEGVDPEKLNPILLNFDNKRAAQKKEFFGELYIADSRAEPSGTCFVEFFQRDRDGNTKGIVAIDLRKFK